MDDLCGPTSLCDYGKFRRIRLNKLAQKLKEQALRQWRWLSENPTHNSIDYYDAQPNTNPPLNYCPLCEYAKSMADRYEILCKKCPLYGNWKGPDGVFDVCFRVKRDDEDNCSMTYYMQYTDQLIDVPFGQRDMKLTSDLAAEVVKNIEEEWQDRDISHMLTERSGK